MLAQQPCHKAALLWLCLVGRFCCPPLVRVAVLAADLLQGPGVSEGAPRAVAAQVSSAQPGDCGVLMDAAACWLEGELWLCSKGLQRGGGGRGAVCV